MTVLPAIDILDGKCVRLLQGNYNEVTEYSSDPLLVAQKFLKAGFNYLHIIDLDGAKEGNFLNEDITKNLCMIPGIKIQLGGGVRTIMDYEKRIDMGLYEINIGTLALKEPEIIRQAVEKFGAKRIVISIDVKKSKIVSQGWLEDSGKNVSLFMDTMITFGITKFIVTDVLKDGTLKRPNFKLYNKFRKDYPDIILTAAGGISNVEDINQLDSVGVDYAIVGRALYEGNIILQELTRFKPC